MRRTGRRGALLAALTVAATSAGCLPGDAPSTSSSTSATGSGALTEEQATLALPLVSELPVTAYVDKDPIPPDPDQSSYPARCKDVTLAGTTARTALEQRQVHVERGFHIGQGGYLSVRIDSYSTPVPGEIFDMAGEAIAECQSFQLIDKEGTTSWDLVDLAFPNLGDRTYAVRATNTTRKHKGYKGNVEVAGIAVGHNLVKIVYAVTPPSKETPGLSEKVARRVLDNLEHP